MTDFSSSERELAQWLERTQYELAEKSLCVDDFVRNRWLLTAREIQKKQWGDINKLRKELCAYNSPMFKNSLCEPEDGNDICQVCQKFFSFKSHFLKDGEK